MLAGLSLGCHLRDVRSRRQIHRLWPGGNRHCQRSHHHPVRDELPGGWPWRRAGGYRRACRKPPSPEGRLHADRSQRPMPRPVPKTRIYIGRRDMDAAGQYRHSSAARQIPRDVRFGAWRPLLSRGRPTTGPTHDGRHRGSESLTGSPVQCGMNDVSKACFAAGLAWAAAKIRLPHRVRLA